jgi:hypothetical protein
MTTRMLVTATTGHGGRPWRVVPREPGAGPVPVREAGK